MSPYRSPVPRPEGPRRWSPAPVVVKVLPSFAAAHVLMVLMNLAAGRTTAALGNAAGFLVVSLCALGLGLRRSR